MWSTNIDKAKDLEAATGNAVCMSVNIESLCHQYLSNIEIVVVKQKERKGQ